MTDRLAALFEHFHVGASVFHTGALCGITDLEAGPSGQLHLVRAGEVEVVNEGRRAAVVREPSLLLYPRPMPHRFVTDPARGADFVCAHLHFAGDASHPLAAALPAFTYLPLAEMEGAADVLAVIFDEAFAERCGRKCLLDRLFEVVLIQALRHLMEHAHVRVGLLAGLAHRRLRHALVGMHERPAEEWSLQSLADAARMSRSVFATRFRDVVGMTPGQYLQGWRISLAQKALRDGQPLKFIADRVGYGSEAALSRAFKAQTRLSPREWKSSGIAARARPR